MADQPGNSPSPDPSKGPWIYSGDFSNAGHYTPPTPKPAADPSPSSPTPTPVPQPPPFANTPPAPAPSPAVPRSVAAQSDSKKHDDSDASLAQVVDTIEAIIIALIVALTFRAFIVEAFVIPTGSMAPTLLGAHYIAVCPECGYEFTVDTPLYIQADDNQGHYSLRPYDPNAELTSNSLVPFDQNWAPIYCPNCRYPMGPQQLPQYLGRVSTVNNKIIEDRDYVWTNNGDRILVLKYLYSVMEPTRWDVIVFKEPEEVKANYIKRLIGLPGETVQIVNGDIYILPKGALDPKDFKIARKPEALQQDLWQVVYDNDFYPMDEGKPRPITAGSARAVNDGTPWTNPWEPADSAHWAKGPVMRYTGQGTDTLHFNVMPAYARNGPLGLNTLGYNDDLYAPFRPSEAPKSFLPANLAIVGDLRLETTWIPDSENGSISMTLGRPNNCYKLTWNAGQLSLLRLRDGKFQDPDGKAVTASVDAPRKGQAYRIALNNVDRSAQVYINGDKVLSYEQEWTRAQALAEDPGHPNNPDTLINIDVGGPCSLSHLKLFRDLYYTSVESGRGTAVFEPLLLGNDEFFALGDNSRFSRDGRLWATVYPALGDLDIRPGIVPRRYLLGKAFFVYWPAGFRPSDSLPMIKDMPIVPNTGQMRSIR